MSVTVMVVAQEYYSGEDLTDTLREYVHAHVPTGIKVLYSVLYRTHFVEEMIHDSDIVIADMRCNENDEQGVTRPVYYDSAALAREHGKRYINTRRAKLRPHTVAKAVKQIAKKKAKAAKKLV